MKRLATTLAVSALFLAPALVSAASIQLSPTQVSVVAGHTFTVTITATPTGSPIYTTSANLSFNPNVLEATSFSLAPTWIGVTQNGYDSMDNTNGVLIKTGGYPAGFNTPTTFGTVTFTAKAAGTATIAATGNSVLLDGGSNNEISGAQGSVTVTVRNAPAPKTQNTTSGSAATGSGTTPSTASSANSASSTSASTTTGSNAGQTADAASAIGTSSQTAAAGSIFSNGIPAWLWWLLFAIVVLGGGYVVWRRYFSTNA